MRGVGQHASGLMAAVALMMPRRATRRRWRRLLREGSGARLASGTDPSAISARWAVGRSRRGVRWLIMGTAGIAGLVIGGPVAALLFGAYAVAGSWLAHHYRVRAQRSRSWRRSVDAVAGLAAELRAGVGVGAALAGASTHLDDRAVMGAAVDTVTQRVLTAMEVAQSSGAPLADVLDRLDHHLRAVDRAQATAAAQAAGARASALLLAAMPVAGAGMGFLVGTDPLHTLWHTPLGAGCLFVAVALQLGGLAWVDRLSRVEVPA